MYVRLLFADDNIYFIHTDHHQYLSQLVILAQIVDDDFQQSIRKMYGIDKITGEAIISFNESPSSLSRYK